MERIKSLITAESVSPGHPDSYMDYIVNSILDMYLAQDPNARVAIDGVVKNKFITLGGEITSTAKITNEDIINKVKQCTKDIGYDFEPEVTLHLYTQSPDIALGTNDFIGGAGDQGTITGFACNESPTYMPLEKSIVDALIRKMYIQLRDELDCIKADIKSQVTLALDNDNNTTIHTVVYAIQHTVGTSREYLSTIASDAVIDVSTEYGIPLDPDFKLIVNGTGAFVLGGPEADSGEVGRKIVVDAYGVRVPVGGGTYNGKDPSKVDRSAAYMARYVAKNIVAAHLAETCLITVSYCIGLADPISIDYEFYGSNSVPADIIIKAVDSLVSFRPKDIIDTLNLRRPIYATSGLISHYGLSQKIGLDGGFVKVPWEQLDLVKPLNTKVNELLTSNLELMDSQTKSPVEDKID